MHIRCPHCHNPIEVVESDPLTDVTCSSCGSNFSLISGETATYQPGVPKTIAHFELLENVGGGHFGTVWKARDTKLDRTVAVKIPRRGQLEPAEAEGFLREARAAAQVKHPGVVGMHEVGREGDTLYIVSDFVEGANLKDWLTARRLTPREAAELCIRIAEALHEAHEAGVVHRDLKPGNIMVDMAGEPHITDFGLAKREAGEITMTMEGQILGTPAYMSPEQAGGKAHEADRRSDVYSLGVILFELLTGELPFRGSQRMMIVQILNEDPPHPRKLQSRIPRDLETICLKCLEKEPGRRYGTAQDVSEELRRFLVGEAIQARPIGRIARGWRWCKRKPAVAGLMGTIASLLVFLSVGGPAVALKQASLRHEAEVARNEATERARSEERLRKLEETARHQAERNLYFNCIAMANQKWQSGDARGARRMLEACPRELRHWEWGYLNRMCNWGLLTFHGHTGNVRGVSFSPDGRRIASGSADKTVRVWDAATGQEVLTLQGHADRVQSVAFSPDGRRIVSGSYDKTVRVWDAATGQEVLTLQGHADRVQSVAFSPDGRRIVSGSYDKTVRVWDAATGQEVLTLQGHTDTVSSVAFSPDGLRIVSGSHDKTVRVRDAATGQEALTLQGHTDQVFGVAFSPDGRRIVSGSGDRTVRVWDAATGQEVLTLQGHTDPVFGVAFSPDGRRIVSGSKDRTVKVWDVTGGQEVRTLGGFGDTVTCVAFSPDGQRIVAGGWDERIVLWDDRVIDRDAASSHEVLTLQGHTSTVECVAFSPDGRRIVSGGGLPDGTVRVWDAATGQQVLALRGHTGSVLGVAFSPDGQRIVSGGGYADRTVRVWDAATGQEVLTLQGHTDRVNSVAFSPDGRRIVSGSDDKTVKVWDAVTGQEVLTLQAHAGGMHKVAFSPDGRRIVSGSDDKTVRVWDAASGQEVLALQGHTGDVLGVAFSPDGRRIVSGGGFPDRTVRVWDAATGQEVLMLQGHTDRVCSVAFSPDGRRIVSGSDDKTVKVWDAVTGQEVLTLQGHAGGVHKVAFSPDGRRIVSGGLDGTAKVWDSRAPGETRREQGRRYCFSLNDWCRGLPLLLYGSDERLRLLAEREYSVAPTDANEIVGLADAWWEAGREADGADAEAMRLRAGYWYRRTQLQLTDDEAKKVAARLAQIASIKRPMPIASYCETALGMELPNVQWADVLPSVSTDVRDTRGEWRHVEHALTVKQAEAARIVLPVSVEGSYEFSTEFTPGRAGAEGHGGVVFLLPVGSTWATVALGGKGGGLSGLVLGQDWRNNWTTTDEMTFVPDRKYTVHAQVWCHGDEASVIVWVDGRQLIWWEGKPTELGNPAERWGPLNTGYLTLGADNAAATFHRVLVRMLDGKGHLRLPPSEIRAIAGGGPIDLLPLIESERDCVQGTWRREGGSLVSPNLDGARIMVPVAPPEEYRLRLVVERKEGENGLMIGLVAGGHQFVATLDFQEPGKGSVSALENVDGHRVTQNETTFTGDALADSGISTVVCTVLKDRVTVERDGKTIIDWKGDSSRLSVDKYWTVPETRYLFLGAYDCSYAFHKLELTPLPVAEEAPRDDERKAILPAGESGNTEERKGSPGQ